MIVSLLLAKGAHVEQSSKTGDTPLLLAAGASTRLRNNDRATATDVAEARSLSKLVELLQGGQAGILLQERARLKGAESRLQGL